MMTAVTVSASRNADRNADSTQNSSARIAFERTPSRMRENRNSSSSFMKWMPATMNISSRITGKLCCSSS
ncbi:hypothetical protein D3C71_1887820 [compost metagenome]